MKNIQYRTFDQLLSDVAVDMPKFNQEGFIEPAQLIKVAQYVNYDLGLKLNKEKTAMVEICNGKAKLPDDLQYLLYSTVCTRYKVTQDVPSGTFTEDIIITPSNTLNPESPCITQTSCGQAMHIRQTLKKETRVYDVFAPIHITPGKWVDRTCFNTRINAEITGRIQDGYLYTNITTGTVFISYLGSLEDFDGNLLVPDHPMLNEYYEYAVKRRVLENMLIDGEDVVRLMDLVEARHRAARNNALSVVNTPDFAELKRVINMNREAMHKRYYSIFI